LDHTLKNQPLLADLKKKVLKKTMTLALMKILRWLMSEGEEKHYKVWRKDK